MTPLRYMPVLLNALRRVDVLDRIYQLRHHRPIHCGDDDCTDDHG